MEYKNHNTEEKNKQEATTSREMYTTNNGDYNNEHHANRGDVSQYNIQNHIQEFQNNTMGRRVHLNNTKQKKESPAQKKEVRSNRANNTIRTAAKSTVTTRSNKTTRGNKTARNTRVNNIRQPLVQYNDHQSSGYTSQAEFTNNAQYPSASGHEYYHPQNTFYNRQIPNNHMGANQMMVNQMSMNQMINPYENQMTHPNLMAGYDSRQQPNQLAYMNGQNHQYPPQYAYMNPNGPVYNYSRPPGPTEEDKKNLRNKAIIDNCNKLAHLLIHERQKFYDKNSLLMHIDYCTCEGKIVKHRFLKNGYETKYWNKKKCICKVNERKE